MNSVEMIEQLKAMIMGTTRVPGLKNRGMIDLDSLMDLIDELQNNLPIEIQESNEILKQKESIVKSAMMESSRIKDEVQKEMNSKREDAQKVVDEMMDKANEEFEAFLLEILSDFQVTIPEIGTIKASKKPVVFLTSNNTRDIGDALKRRCLHLYIPLPDAKLEEQIVTARVPEIDARLRQQVVCFVQFLRDLDLKKLPSISETLDWARALILLHVEELDAGLIRETLNVLLKFEDDIAAASPHINEIVRKARRKTG